MPIVITQSTEVERLAEEAERNRTRLLRYYVNKKMSAVITGKQYRVPLKHVHLFDRSNAK
jgi:hypothetical protein